VSPFPEGHQVPEAPERTHTHVTVCGTRSTGLAGACRSAAWPHDTQKRRPHHPASHLHRSAPTAAQDKAAAPKDAAPKDAAPKDAAPKDAPPPPPLPPCECALPKDGNGFFGTGAELVSRGCECKNA
jgi:hypothetical protein